MGKKEKNKTMKRILLFTLTVLFFQACQSPTLEEKIQKQEQQLKDQQDARADTKAVNKLLDNYLVYAEENPADSITPHYLFKAADLMMNTGKPAKAITQLDKIMNRYPDFEKASDALFLKGFILENHLGKLGRAKEVYELFLEKYPDHVFADDVEVSLQNLGRTPEEMVREFEKRKQE